jgi:ribonuclease HI
MHKALKLWLLEWFSRLEEKELAVGLMALYHMWLDRNDAREALMIEDPDRIARRVLALTEEWMALKESNSEKITRPAEHWLPPEEGWVKVNVDGAFSKEGGSGGGGVIMRDRHGGFLAGSSHVFPQVSDPERAELLACKQGVVLAKEKGEVRAVLEMDCLGAVAKLKGRELDRSMQGPLVEEIKELLGEFEDIRMTHVRRSCNGVAYVLAQLGCKNKVDAVWVDVPPSCIGDLVNFVE